MNYKLTPQTGFKLHTENSHPRLTLRKVLFTKFLRWVDKTPTTKLLRSIGRSVVAIFIVLSYVVPQFMFGLVASHIGFKSVTAICLILAFLYWKIVARKLTKKVPNQHTFHGVPVPELTDYLFESGFTMDAIKELGLAQRQYRKIAQELEAHKLLERGECNSRILNKTITRAQVSRQLQDNFPLAYHNGEWAERDGAWRTFLKDEETKEQKEREREDRIKRKEKSLKKKASELDKVFASRRLEYV